MGSGGWRYLEAAPRDLPQAQWGAHGKAIDGTAETGIGSGKKNTERIVAKLKEWGESGRAAQLCDGYEVNGYKDWFLPSKDELDLMYKNLKAKDLGNFKDEGYWSSSQYGSTNAWCQYFGDGGGQYTPGVGKRGTTSVRAIRAF
jgi:hypothetical protein